MVPFLSCRAGHGASVGGAAALWLLLLPFLFTAAAAAVLDTRATGGATVANTILCFATDPTSAQEVTLGLQGYGVPSEVVIVPQQGITLPTLNSSATAGNYGGIVVLSEVTYDYSTGWASAITADQWQTLYNYQTSFGVRMVRLDVYPSTDFGVTTAIADTGCCNAGVEQYITINDSSTFPTANIKTGATLSTEGIYHYPAVITNSSSTTAFAQFAPDSANQFTSNSAAAVINNFGGRQQMVWFMGWATSWSQTCNYMNHAWIQWMTRGLFVGKRKIYLNTQVDDMHLSTDIYLPSNTEFRLRTTDLGAHVTWQANINTRLPSGSAYFIEIGHNGNGDIEEATGLGSSAGQCTPDYAVEYPTQPDDVNLELIKPLGTGTDIWPAEFTNYTWSLQCAELDSLASWFNKNPSAFAAVSHTFTHEDQDNATYHDVYREISFNIAWLSQIGLAAGSRFSANGLIPPAITGLHNGDALQAWADNGITYCVGDNTRPVLRNPTNTFWPLITNVSENGYAGMTVIPRWATTIYYNCYSANCTLQEWIATSAGSGQFADLLDNARTTNSRYLLGLYPDPYMFHQANLRQGDVDIYTVGSVTGALSLLQIWVETVTQEMVRLTNWPIASLKHDDMGVLFTNRMTLDNCNPNLSYQYSSDGTSITSVTVTASGNTCSVPVPLSVPGTASGSGEYTTDQVGSEPTIYWATLSGSPVTFTLGTPVTL